VLRKRVWPGLVSVSLGTSLIVAMLVVQAACAPGAPGAPSAPRSPGSPSAPATATTRSLPLIYGINMALYDTNDQLTNDATTQLLLRRERIPIIRMPSRTFLSDAYVLQALRTVKRIGAIPLLIVHGPDDPNAAADDTHLLTLVRSVFGAGTVYVEFGNEPDLVGIDVSAYTQAWNRIVPQLKAMAPTYRFVGPVVSDPNATYIAAFDALASPRPDANSWHQYTCTSRDADDVCLSRVAGWSADVRQINTAVRASIGTTLPLMLTEWNLDADADPRYANAQFMQAWTAQALQTLAANAPNGLMAAMQYCATNNAVLQLIDYANHLTPEGQAFFAQIERSGGAGNGTPAPTG
jgi:hypothetical protein